MPRIEHGAFYIKKTLKFLTDAEETKNNFNKLLEERKNFSLRGKRGFSTQILVLSHSYDECKLYRKEPFNLFC